MTTRTLTVLIVTLSTAAFAGGFEPGDGASDALSGSRKTPADNIRDPGPPIDPEAAIADQDGDLVVDGADNCLAHDNPGQRDADADGFGNRCDPDFDNDGDVDADDENRLQSALAAGPASPKEARLLDLDEDNDVDDDDLAILMAFLGGAPGPIQDLDGDGTGDRSDRCPGTPASAVAVTADCSALGAMQRPNRLTDPLGNRITAIADRMRDDPDRDGVFPHLDAAAVFLGDAADAVRNGDPCGADAGLGEAALSLAAAQGELQLLWDEAIANQPDIESAPDDTSPEIRQLVFIGRDQSEVGRAESDRDALQVAFDSLCGAAAPWAGSGVVEVTDDAAGRFILDDGTIVGFNEVTLMEGNAGPGSSVVLDGFDFGNGHLFAASVSSDLITPNIGFPSCTELRFAPIQRFADWGGTSPMVLMHPEAYEVDGRYRWERDMRIAAEDVCHDGGPISGASFSRYSLRLRILMWSTPSQVDPLFFSLGPDLEPGETPVPIPDYFYQTSIHRVVLRVETMERLCTSTNGISCDPPVKIREKDYELERKPRGGVCSLSYDRETFAIDDFWSGSWDQTWVDSVVVQMPSDIATSFVAKGLELCPDFGGGYTPCNNYSSIFENHSFALRNWDYHPIHPPFDPTEREQLYRTTGVDRAAGLGWPRVRGKNNGRTWQFSCSVPKVARDGINLHCPPTAFLRLPFAEEGEGTWWVSQGSFSSPGRSHENGYAYDLIGECGHTVRAARAGRVSLVIDNRSCQFHSKCGTDVCGSSCCSLLQIQNGRHGGNWVLVTHQDGSVGEYVHFRQNEVAVNVGEVVQRGEVLGYVGTTGSSSDPHLHFQYQGLGDVNMIALFQADDPNNPGEKLTCYEPDQPDDLKSDNLAR